jgi:hypothetical protein
VEKCTRFATAPRCAAAADPQTNLSVTVAITLKNMNMMETSSFQKETKHLLICLET